MIASVTRFELFTDAYTLSQARLLPISKWTSHTTARCLDELHYPGQLHANQASTSPVL
jgi:hypothetical protein